MFINCGTKQESKSNVSDTGKKNSVNQNETAGKNSEVKKNTVPDKDEITIKTPDSKELSANYYYSKDSKDKAEPLVILIHQFTSTKEQWQQSFIDSLNAQGYKVLAYDIRGHGKSSKVSYDLTKLLEDPVEAPNDIKGVISWAKLQQGIDSTRIAAIGTSIGGNVGFYAKYNLGLKALISISNGKETFEKYLGINEAMMGRMFLRMNNTLLICGDKDGDCETGQRFIYDNFLDDPKEIKVFDSSKHGKFLIEEHSEIYTLSLNWLKKNL
jgi:dienelactone hydrolase